MSSTQEHFITKPVCVVHVDLIGSYIKSIGHQQLGGAIINNNASLSSMTIINPDMGQFEIFEVPTFDLDEGTGGIDDYIDNSSARVSQLFKNTWLSRYPCPQKCVFDNGSEFKEYFTHLLNYFDIKPV